MRVGKRKSEEKREMSGANRREEWKCRWREKVWMMWKRNQKSAILLVWLPENLGKFTIYYSDYIFVGFVV